MTTNDSDAATADVVDNGWATGKCETNANTDADARIALTHTHTSRNASIYKYMCLGIGVFSLFCLARELPIGQCLGSRCQKYPKETIDSKIIYGQFFQSFFLSLSDDLNVKIAEIKLFLQSSFLDRRIIVDNKLALQWKLQKGHNNPWLILIACTFTSTNWMENSPRHHKRVSHILLLPTSANRATDTATEST